MNNGIDKYEMALKIAQRTVNFVSGRGVGGVGKVSRSVNCQNSSSFREKETDRQTDRQTEGQMSRDHLPTL